MKDNRGWRNEPGRHSLAARGIETTFKARGYPREGHLTTEKTRDPTKPIDTYWWSWRDAAKHYASYTGEIKGPSNLSESTPEFLDWLRNNTAFLEYDKILTDLAKNEGFFKGIRADGKPHLKKGAGSNGIAYEVDPEGHTATIMEITSIPDATGDPYWTRKQAGCDTKWGTDHDKAYVLTQGDVFDLTDLIEASVRGDVRFAGAYGDRYRVMDLMLSGLAHWGGTEEALYHSRAEAWKAFQKGWKAFEDD